MPGSSPTRGKLFLVRLTLALGLAGLLGLFLLFRPFQEAQGAPQATAGFQTTDQLKLSIEVPASRKARKLSVELLDDKGAVIASTNQDLEAGPATQARVLFEKVKVKPEQSRVRCKLDGKTVEVALNTILLARAHETTVSASTELFAGSQGEMLCKVHGVKSITKSIPLVADVTVTLTGPEAKAQTLFDGKTGTDGQARVSFKVPDLPAGQYTLQVKTRSALGEESLQRQVKVQTAPKLLLTTDKPLYQPGQTMHLRTLALRSFDLVPAAKADLVFEVEDAKGNKVFKKETKTSEYGIASVDFTLADEVNMGEYRLRALMGDHRAEKTVTVKKYVLPKFKVDLKTDKTFYLPKETIRGTLQVDYFFGKPVASGKIEIKASTFDVAFKEFQTIKATTDRSGHATFEITLPGYFVGHPLAGGKALVKVDARVTDSADHTEALTRTYPVSDQPIRLSLLPESGRLIPGLENRIFAAAIYPDGSPAACTVDVYLGKESKGKPIASVKTNPAGLAEFRLTPKAEQFRADGWGQRNVEMLGGTQQHWGPNNFFDLTAKASDQRGAKVETTVALSSDPLGENLLLRLDRAIYKGGDTLTVDVGSTAGMPTVYLDVIKSGQTMLTRWLDVKEGKARTTIDLPAHLFGTLEVHAYQILSSGEVVRDARVVYVNPASDLQIKVTPDKDTYHPGNRGTVRFEVTDGAGKPTPAALGVLIVDEAVYALQEIQPGLEKVFFTLQKELLEPAAQANFRPGEPLDVLVRQQELPPAKQQIAQALLTAIRPKAPGRWQVDPEITRRQQLAKQVQQVGWSLFQFSQAHKTVLVQDRKTGKWDFQPDLLDKVVLAKQLDARQLNDSLGGKLTLERLAEMEANFTPEKFGIALTRTRMENLLWTFVNHTNANQAKWLKGGKWTFPDDVVAQCARLIHANANLDAWARPFTLVKRSAKEKNTTGQGQFDSYKLVSAGPDGKVGTRDDVEYATSNAWIAGWTWWQSGDQGTGVGVGALAWRTAGKGQMNPWGMPMGGGMGFGGGGMFPPGAIAPGTGGPRDLARAGAPMIEATARPVPKMVADRPGGGTTTAAPAEAPVMRLREYFPETLLWQPALITDNRGRATLEIPFADSITTWRLSASASSRLGGLGGGSAPLRVFQDFFVDLDLPVALTQNDEVAFPVAVYNYLKSPQTLHLELKQEPWFELIDSAGPKRALKLEAGQVTALRFRIKAKKVGSFPLTVTAKGSKMSDAIKRVIEVIPDGKAIEQVFTDRLTGTIKHRVNVPRTAIEDASKLYVKVYPGVISQVVEGLDGMLRMPTGCFEQTSSSAYPNILVVDYIKKSRQGSPALLARAEQFLGAGYQRLLTFERPGGGFDWWGTGEPLVWLSAYGLQEFNDMSKVYPIDRGIIDRTQAWLLKQQGADGTWSKIGATHGESIERMGDPKLLLTSYVTWALLDSMPRSADWKKKPEYASLAKAIGYIREQAPKADNAYILALAANALASWDAKDDSTFDVVKRVLRKLDEKKQHKPEWKAICFPATGQSLCYGRDDSLVVETTALACLAMIKSGQFTTSVNQSLTYLVKTKGAHGHWGSTQATILALKALLGGTGGSEPRETTPFTIEVDGKQVATGEVTPKNADVLQLFDLTPHLKTGETTVSLLVKGETSLMYQVVGRHFEPHRGDDRPAKPTLEVDVSYDRTKLSTADLLKATGTLKYHGKTATYNVIVDLPIPPGFTVDAGDFAEMVAAKKVQKFSVTARQVILYLGDVKPGSEHSFVYSLRPKYPIKARTAPAVAYEYYTPANRATAKPVELVVEEKK